MSGLRGIKTTRTSKRRDELRATSGSRIAMHESAQFETIRTHARAIVEGEGAEENDPALVEAVARAIYTASGGTRPNDPVVIGEPGGKRREGSAWEWYVREARAALSTIRKHQAGE